VIILITIKHNLTTGKIIDVEIEQETNKSDVDFSDRQTEALWEFVQASLSSQNLSNKAITSF